MDVEGLHANAPGDKAKVFGMQEGDSDFITNRLPHRHPVSRQQPARRPTRFSGACCMGRPRRPRSLRYEPDTAKRFASVFLLNPGDDLSLEGNVGPSEYFESGWSCAKAGISGPALSDYGLPTPRGTYAPNPHNAYLGAPIGRSGGESATIPGTTTAMSGWRTSPARSHSAAPSTSDRDACGKISISCKHEPSDHAPAASRCMAS